MSFSIFDLDKLNKFLIVVFFICCVYLFGGVSNISKFILFIILFLIFLINLFLNKFKNLTNKFFIIFSLFLVYIVINAFLFSKVQFESKLEFLNFILYVLVFYTFANIKDDSVEIWYLSFFLIQFSFLLLYLVYKEKSIYFFVYNPNIFSGWSLFSFLFSLVSIYKYKLINFFSIFNLVVSFLFLIILKNFSGIYIALIFLSLMFIKNRVFSVVLLFSILTIGMVFKFSSIFDRVIWLIIGIKIWLQHLFFGVGLGNFKFYYQQYSLHLPATSTATLFVHNYFLHILSEIGIIGGAFLFFVLFYSLVPKKKIYFYPVLGILLQNLIDYNLLIPMNGVLLFSSLGCLSKEKGFFVGNSSDFINWIKNFVIIFIFLYGINTSFYLSEVESYLKANDFLKAINKDKTCWYAWQGLAEEEFKKNNFKEAERYFLQVIKNNPLHAESYLYLSIINFKLKQKHLGYKYLKEAIKLNPKAANRYKRRIDEAMKDKK